MSSCLGIYIESNLIKYAKVSKERDNIKLDAYGVKFYDNIQDAVEQVVNETFSYNIPVSINLRDEKYHYFEMFSLLRDKDMTKAIETEFELLCNDRGYNKNTLDSRYVLVTNQEDRDKTKAMHISCSKAEISKYNQNFQKFRVKTISPLPVAIINDIEIGVKENAAILNLEEEISLTTIINGQINKVDIIDKGMDEIFEKINRKENSYAKVYDILKNTTIYTSEGRELSEDNDNYLQDIMPTLYDVVNIVKENISQNINNIEKLFITGTGAVINNIDLYFQEFLTNTKCQILKPYFIRKSAANITNIRDYIEVNSAIALGLQGLGEGVKNINFKSTSTFEKLKEIGNMERGGKGKGGKKSQNQKNSLSFSFDLNEELNQADVALLRLAGACAIIIIVYIIGTMIIAGLINQKKAETEAVIADTNAQISKINEDTQKINNKTAQYNTLIRKLDEINTKIADANSIKNSIPNLLSRIMVVVPKNVQITSIRNTTAKHVIINIQATEYDPIGYFLGAINNNGILVNAKSNSSVKQEGIIKLTIEGDMP